MMKRITFIILSVLLAGNFAMGQQEIKLYPKGAPESNGINKKERVEDDAFVTHISEARMYSFLVSKEKASGAAVLICPGGGYWGLSTEKEGVDFARWLNDLGISAFVLYYRMPNGHSGIPLKDAQMAMEIIRKNSEIWNLDKNKIGVAGFSAGGHLASTLGTHFTAGDRPDFMILFYPVITMSEYTHGGSKDNLLGKDPSAELVEYYSNEVQVKENTPPAFLVHALDDEVVPIENSYMFRDALQQKGISAEMYTLQKGGHGFGLRKENSDVDSWLGALKIWLDELNLTTNK